MNILDYFFGLIAGLIISRIYRHIDQRLKRRRDEERIRRHVNARHHDNWCGGTS